MKTILIVDDGDLILQMLQVALERAGYYVATASNGREGLDRVSELHPELVICDLVMPVMGGREMYRALQAHPRYKSIPVILMSAIEQQPLEDVPFLVKPFTMPDMLQLVAEQIGTTDRT
ncbi:MAG TPA: response regulator [Herpetosiphonaceae bacterium]